MLDKQLLIVVKKSLLQLQDWNLGLCQQVVGVPPAGHSSVSEDKTEFTSFDWVGSG